MNPVAFEIFGIPIMWYGIILSTGILVGIFLAYNEAKRKGYNPEIIIDIALWCVPIAVVGARLYYVIFEWNAYKDNLIEIINIRGGGLAIHGAIIAAVITGYIFTRVRKISFWDTADIAAPSIIIGQAIGRWGNFMNGEAHGGVVSEKFISFLPDFIKNQMYIGGNYYHPTFLYESVWNFLVFAFLFWYRKRKKADGEVFLLYGILYSVGRFFIEGMRTDSLMFMGMRTAQLVSIVTIVIFGLLIYYLRKRKNEGIGTI